MLYKFDKNNLTYKKVTGKLIIIGIATLIGLVATASIITILQVPTIKYISEEQKAIVLMEQDEFTPQRLKAYILQLNIKYPYIVLAQAEIESGHFTSKLFKENHNIFGMRLANQRPTTALGTENDFAYYHCWKESVEDYAMYSAAYLSNIHTEEQYLQYLKQTYDKQDTNYVSAIHKIINDEKLK